MPDFVAAPDVVIAAPWCLKVAAAKWLGDAGLICIVDAIDHGA